jgi:tetratricopeptide (TPR) repeat protein
MPDLDRDLVFLSYASEDLNQVLMVYEGLKKRKVNVWIDKKDLGKGRWKPQIMKAISRSRDFVICLSNNALKKISGEKPGFQDVELQIAWEFAREQDERGFTIIPIRLKDCGRGDMRLSGWQQYDFFPDLKKGLDQLAVHLGGCSLPDAPAIDERTEDEKLFAGNMGKGKTFYYLGEYDKALSFFEAAINIKPYNHEALNSKGVSLVELRLYDASIEAFNRAIEIKPEYHKAWNNKGLVLINLGLNEDALNALGKAIEIKPDFDKALYNKSYALLNLGRYKEAFKAFDKAIEINPELLNLDTRFTGLAEFKIGINNSRAEIMPWLKPDNRSFLKKI